MWKIPLITVLLIAAPFASLAASIDGRIVGGKESSISKHAHQASVRYKSCSSCAFLHECGGVIYNEDTIITAAHCIYERELGSYVAVVGTDTRTGSDGLIAPVAKAVLHSDYNAALYDNDVALLFLATPITLNGVTIAAVPLAEETPAVGIRSTVSGWGATSEGGAYANKLHDTEVQVISQESCKEAYDEERITESMLCAQARGGGQDACKGDSGGPLLVQRELAGIISWGVGCGRPESPGVYADVAHLRTWMLQTIKENSKFV